MIIRKEVHFDASMEAVWDLLTNPEMTRQYMFGCAVSTNWQVGSSITWDAVLENGEPITYVQGKVLEIIPGKKLGYSMLDPNMGIADIPSNYVNMLYELEETDSGTTLYLTQGDFTGADRAESRFMESDKGWEMVIPLMKKVLNARTK